MNAQGKRKSLTDDYSPVNSVGKVFAGQLLAYYPRCALFEISGCLTLFCGIRDIIYLYNYLSSQLSSHLFHVESLNIVVPGT